MTYQLYGPPTDKSVNAAGERRPPIRSIRHGTRSGRKDSRDGKDIIIIILYTPKCCIYALFFGASRDGGRRTAYV